MIEKLARSVASSTGVDYDIAWPEQQAMFRRIARAVIEALMEPSEVMVKAIRDAAPSYMMDESAVCIFKAALTAALNEGEGE